MNHVIELEKLTVQFGRREILKALTGSLTGESIGLLGPNGAGKTTLLHTLLGFHPARTGTARIFGHDIRQEARTIRRLVGYMPETDAFIAGMTAVRFLSLMAELTGIPKEAALERAHEALFYVGLGEARYRKVETFSLGMKQMVKLAQAIVHGPKILFLDEPTNGLDPPHRSRMIQLIREITRSGKVHLVLSSHLLRDVEDCCEEVLILKDGRIATYCNLEEERKANKKFVEVETRGQNGSFTAALDELGCEWAQYGANRFKMVLPDGVGIRQLYELAEKNQIQLRRFNYKRDSLEDIFLKAMEVDRGSL